MKVAKLIDLFECKAHLGNGGVFLNWLKGSLFIESNAVVIRNCREALVGHFDASVCHDIDLFLLNLREKPRGLSLEESALDLRTIHVNHVDVEE